MRAALVVGIAALVFLGTGLFSLGYSWWAPDLFAWNRAWLGILGLALIVNGGIGLRIAAEVWE
jgi:hypothetical protein